MPVINNPFNGKLNLDVADYRITNADHIDALNITRDAQGQGQDRVVSNILGNSNLYYELPLGTNKIIGFYPDKIRNRAYYFLWNSNGFNSILCYDLNRGYIYSVLVSKTQSSGIDILNFNPSYKVLSVNIFYRDDEGDLLFFNDGYNPPKVINVSSNYPNGWKLEYILVAKAPPVMPPRVTYENDTAVSINNLRNVLFQFSYRYVYDNNEKSVWSSKSIVPLPQQKTLLLTNDNVASNNSRISISVNTGGEDVKAIEISFRETTNGTTSDWFLIQTFNKAELFIQDNDIFTYNFYNDGVYNQLDVLETTQLQDYVPQKANASELANGNVLLYSGITEGYNKTPMNILGTSQNQVNGYYLDYCGLLFFASINGSDSGTSGTTMKIYLFGTGTNTNNIVSTLNNCAGRFVVNASTQDGTYIGANFYNISNTESVSTILNGIKNALLAVSGGGWSFSSIVNNVLTMTNSNSILLLSSGIQFYQYSADIDNTLFANAWESGYKYAIQYFDSLGRTIGAQTDALAAFNTSIQPSGFDVPITKVQIKNRPPLEARYYQVLRSNNTTYNKRLYWISQSAYSSIYVQGSDDERYAYINIDNIQRYNEDISSTKNVVSYTYAEGDRIRFKKRYDADNVEYALPAFDYEVVGTEAVIQYNIIGLSPTDNNTYTATGNFLKIKYPDGDISSSFNFSGQVDYQHYEIFLYNYTNNSSDTQKFFYEFGKCFGIGNPGTATAYHIGLDQTQSATDPIATPAIITTANGDLFYRKRKVPFNDVYNFLSNFITVTTAFTSTAYKTLDINVSNTINNASYKIQSQPSTTAYPTSGYPQYTDTDFFFNNKSTTAEKLLSFKGEISIDTTTTNGSFSLYAFICTSTAKTKVSLLPYEVNNLESATTSNFTIDTKINAPKSSKIWVVARFINNAGTASVTNINSFNFDFEIVKNSTINIIESSFNDTYNLITNSNGRPSIVDVNAKQTYFPTLIRFGGAYQVNTNINRINNFQYENFDEYDRSFGDVIRLHIRDRYLKVYQKFKVGNVPILTQIVKDSANNPLQANTDQLINKIQYYAGDYGIGDAATSLAWNNFADYFVDNYRGVVCRLSQDGITPISITNSVNAFFVSKLSAYKQDLNTGIPAPGEIYSGNPCIYGVFDANTNKYIIAMEEINRYTDCNFNGGSAIITTAGLTTTTTTSTTTAAPTPGQTTTTTSTTTSAPIECIRYTGDTNTSGFFYCKFCGNDKLLQYSYINGQLVDVCVSYIEGVNESDFDGGLNPAGNCQ